MTLPRVNPFQATVAVLNLGASVWYFRQGSLQLALLSITWAVGAAILSMMQ